MNFAMKSSITVGKSTAGTFLKRVGDVAVNLRVTEKILHEIERRLFSPDQTQFDIEFVRTNLQKLRTLPHGTPSDQFLQIEFSLNQEFNLWRGFLEERDRKIETYHLRRFFDTANQSFDQAIFVALTYFYRNSAFFLSNISKFDLVITRLFSNGTATHREARFSRRERTLEVARMFAVWDGLDEFDPERVPLHNDAVARLDEFIFEAETLVDFEDLIKSNIFERLRTFKKDLGAVFFEPDVAAVAVEANLVLGNIFNELLARANQNLGEKLNASFDFAGAFHDTSPNTRAHVSEILKQIKSDAQKFDSSAITPEAHHIWELLEMVCGEAVPKSTPSESEEQHVLRLSATERIAPLLITLDEPEPDVRMLREYTQKSKSLWTIDLNDFIRNDEPELDKLCRDILRVVLVTDELCTHDLNQPKDIPPETFVELSDLFQRTVNLGKTLETLLERHTGALQNRLLVVSNKFLETRLRLERTIVRFSNHHLGLIPNVKEDKPEKPVAEARSAIKSERSPNRVNRWLMALTVLVAFACGGLYFVAENFDAGVAKAEDFEELNVAELPTNEHLTSAYRHRTTIFVITKSSWDTLPDDQKKKALSDFTGIPAPKKIDTVIVTNSEGRPMADLSPNGLNLSPDL